MSVLPLVLDLADGLADLDYGFCLHPQEFRRAERCPRSIFPKHPRLGHRHWPYTALAHRRCDGRDRQTELINSTVGKDGFQVCMDVQQFKPNELTVKTVDNTVIVEGKHEEREDEHGSILRHFVRKYALPKGYDPKEVVSTLSSDGVLTVKAPRPTSKKSKERVIQIQETGPAHLSVKDNPKEGEQENGRTAAADGANMEP